MPFAEPPLRGTKKTKNVFFPKSTPLHRKRPAVRDVLRSMDVRPCDDKFNHGLILQSNILQRHLALIIRKDCNYSAIRFNADSLYYAQIGRVAWLWVDGLHFLLEVPVLNHNQAARTQTPIPFGQPRPHVGIEVLSEDMKRFLIHVGSSFFCYGI